MQFTEYLGKKILNHLLNIQSFTPPSTFYLSLHEQNGTELTDYNCNYARQAISFRHAASDGTEIVSVRSSADLTFNVYESLDDIKKYGVWDAATGGNRLVVGEFPYGLGGDTGKIQQDVTIVEEKISIGIGDPWSEYAQQKILEWLFVGESFSQPTVYIGLVEKKPVFTDGGSDLDEPTVGGYARESYSGSSNWQNDSGDAFTNSSDITFATATADWDKSIERAVLVDASSGGNLLCWVTKPQIESGVDIDNGDTAQIYSGGIDISI